MDVWGNVSEVVFDSINLLPVKVIDPLLNTIQAKYDYRILQALEIIDPNGNRQQAAYDGFGRVIRTAVMGKDSENKGDVLSKNPTKSFSPSDSDTSIMEYHHERFWKEGKPNFVHSYTRETHHHDLVQGEESRWLEARIYSDGFGQELQSKAKIASGKAYFVDNGKLETVTTANPRWLGSGRTIYDNKGQPVKQYEPYFSTTEEYEPEDELTLWGVTPFIHYDALGRVIRTDAPDGTFSKVEFTPWKQLTYDANDTVAESDWYQRMANSADAKEQRAAALSLEHKELPALVILDVLGRPVVTKQKFKTNKPEVGTKQIVKDVQESISKVVLDTVGNPLQTVDANGNIALEVVFDLAGRPLKSISNDAGTSYSFLAIDNQPVYAWLPRGHKTEIVYDNFRRPTELWVTQNGVRTIYEKTIYGEAYTDSNSKAPEEINMRGQVWKSFDQAGFAAVNSYDFKGAPLTTTRYLFKDQTATWTTTRISNLNPTIIANDFEPFIGSINYDALGRTTKSITPDNSIVSHKYDEGGQLQKVIVKLPNEPTKEKVKSIHYNEKGQREKITYGNNAQTTYKYDPLSYQLINLKTQANAHLSGKLLQDLYYTYDAVGNIVEIEDKSQEEVFFKNQRVSPSQNFVYDSLNRLIKASGREHIGQQQGGEQIKLPTAENSSGHQYNNFGSNNPAPTDLTALRNYTQSYAYDKVGNILRWKHQAHGTDSYTRDYKYDYQTPANPSKNLYGNSNRLIETHRGTETTTYDYDAAGNIIQLSNHKKPY